MTTKTPKLVTIQTPRGDSAYVCPQCWEGMTEGRIPAIKSDTGEEYCQVSRGATFMRHTECECPSHR